MPFATGNQAEQEAEYDHESKPCPFDPKGWDFNQMAFLPLPIVDAPHSGMILRGIGVGMPVH